MSLNIIIHSGLIDRVMVKIDLCCQMKVIAVYLVQCVVRLMEWIVQFVWFESYMNAVSPLKKVLLFYHIKIINYKLIYCLDNLLLMFLFLSHNSVSLIILREIS